MTEENYNYRTSQALLRNQFAGKGKLKIPIIPKFEAKQGDFDDLLLIGFDKTHLEDQNHLGRMVHFFLYDYRFERVWKNPDNDLEKLSRYRAVLSPDFSMYLEMAPVMQIYNVFRNRWCGAYWASKGIRVIPSVNWGDENTFDFCFEGIEKGSTVAVSTYMASESYHHEAQKEWFMAGYNEMLRQIEPERIICYNTPFPEMDGNVVYVDYDRSSWRYMNYERGLPKEDLDCYKIGGAIRQEYDIMEPYRIGKGGGSAFGGKWKPNPNKPNDMAFVGDPNSRQRHFIPTKKGGYWVEGVYNETGKADIIRHETEHGGHSNPHDHKIEWVGEDNHPEWGEIINYPDRNVPELKVFYRKGVKIMTQYDPEALRFKTISDFKWSMHCGAEVEIEWKGKEFGIWSDRNTIRITSIGSAERKFNSTDDALEYIVCGDRLRDVITQVTVIDRTI